MLIVQAELTDGLSVLEVGCGTGNLITRVARQHLGVTAAAAIRILGRWPEPSARPAGSGITFDRGYVQKLPYADGRFDRVLSSMMWHHLDEDVKAEAAAQIYRVLRPGGSLHLVDVGGEV